MLWSDPTRLGQRHRTRIRFHLLLVRVDSGNLVSHGCCRVSAKYRRNGPGDGRDELGEDRSGSLVASVIRVLFGEAGFCFDDICPADLFTGLDRENKLGPILWDRERSSIGELCDF